MAFVNIKGPTAILFNTKGQMAVDFESGHVALKYLKGQNGLKALRPIGLIIKGIRKAEWP